MPLGSDEIIQKVIIDYAGMAVKVAGVEEAVKDLRVQLNQALNGINESLRLQTSILEKLNQNIEEHKLLHKRIDTAELKAAEDRIMFLQKQEELREKVELIDKQCYREEHEKLVLKVAELEKTQEASKTKVDDHDRWVKILNGKVGITLLAMILISFAINMIYHYDLIKKILFKG